MFHFLLAHVSVIIFLVGAAVAKRLLASLTIFGAALFVPRALMTRVNAANFDRDWFFVYSIVWNDRAFAF